MEYLVTGGAGFVGSHLVDTLLDKGHRVTVLDNLSTGNLKNLRRSEIEFLCHDIRNSDFLFGNLSKRLRFDGIFHLAAMARIQPSFDDPCSTLDINSQGTANILELARKSGARLVYAGSSTFYFDVLANPYAYAKWIGEQHCQMYRATYGMPVGAARFFNVYGPRQIEEGPYCTVVGVFEKQLREGKVLTVTGDGKQRRDFTHVQDIVNGLIAIDETYLQGRKQEEDMEIFALGTGRNHSINELADMFQSQVEYIPKRPGEASSTLAEIERTKEVLGWRPIHKLEDYVKNVVGA